MPEGFFLVRHALMDREFEKVRDLVPLVEVNTTAAHKHVAAIERKIWHVNERVRATTSKYSFRWMPIMILVHTVYFCVFV